MTTTISGRSPLEKAIDQAYNYHPYGFRGPQRLGMWVVGPTFMVLPPEPVTLLSPEKYPHATAFIQQFGWDQQATKFFEEDTGRGIDVDIDRSGHPMDKVAVKDRHGAKKMTGPEKCTARAVRIRETSQTLLELAWPLFNIARKVEPKFYTLIPRSQRIYGHDGNGNTLVIVRARSIGEQCRP